MPGSPFAILDRTVPRRIIFGLLLAAAVGAMVWVATKPGPSTLATTADDPAIEALIPGDGAVAPRQSEVGIDLVEGYRATLTINDVVIPPDQIEGSGPSGAIPALNRYAFVPGPGKAIESLHTGLNCVTAEFWLATTPNETRVQNWCFQAA